MTQDSNAPNGGNHSFAPDWALIEVEYRAGIKPLRSIGEEHGVSHVAIGKRARRDGWVRDLGAKIRARADELVTKAAVTKEVTKEKAATQKQVVEVNAQIQYRVRMEHRADISRSRRLFCTLLTEVEAVGVDVERLRTLCEAVATPGPEGTPRAKDQIEAAKKAREQLEKVLNMHGRIDSAKRLVEILEKLVKMERQAFGIAPDDDGENPSHPSGHGRTLSDAERAVRLARLLATGIALPVGIAA